MPSRIQLAHGAAHEWRKPQIAKSSFPLCGRCSKELAQIRYLRLPEVLVWPYRVTYSVTGYTVLVLAISGGPPVPPYAVQVVGEAILAVRTNRLRPPKRLLCAKITSPLTSYDCRWRILSPLEVALLVLRSRNRDERHS